MIKHDYNQQVTSDFGAKIGLQIVVRQAHHTVVRQGKVVSIR